MPKILVVDDEEVVRTGLARLLERAGHLPRVAAGVAEARDVLLKESFDLVLCDIQMLPQSGFVLLEQIAAELPDTATLVVTGVDDPDTAARALELGTYGYVVKPFGPNEILINVMNALTRRDLVVERRRYTEELESKLMDRTSSLRQAIRHLEEERSIETAGEDILDRLSRALALRNEETGRHIERVGLYAALLAREAQVEEFLIDNIRRASLLHDAGKIGIPDAILTKPGKLTAQERKTVERHAELGYQLLSGSTSPVLNLAANIALTHHERWDGCGYPRGLQGPDIPIEGRIVAIADVFDALTSDRVYRAAYGIDDALDMMRAERGKHFESSLLDRFVDRVEELRLIRSRHPDEKTASSERLSVLVVDDQDLLAEAMVRLLEASAGIEVVGSTRTAGETISLAQRTKPDVLLLDWKLPDGTGADILRAIRVTTPKTKTVVLSGLPDEAILAEAIECGCSAVLTKTRPFDEVLETIKAAHTGQITIPVSRLHSVLVRSRSSSPQGAGELSPREIEVLQLLSEGLSNESIAERLFISLNTVRNHVQHIIVKLGAHSKLEAVTLALRRGVIRLSQLGFH